MIKVKFSKVPAAHLQILQSELLYYAEGFNEHLKKPEDYTVFLYSIAQVDIAQKLWFSFRTKLENGQKSFSFMLSASEAVCLSIALTNTTTFTDKEYVANVAHTYINIIDHQFKSLNTPAYEKAKQEVLSA